jgi:hypothetical protein
VGWLGNQDQQGAQLRDGIYGCIVTVENLTGQVSQRHAVFRVGNGVASFQESGSRGLKAAASAEEEDNLVILRADEALPLTLVSHDGNEGWIESGSGGISLYAGGLSQPAGRTPHLRVTPEGNIGIGVRHPEVKLDVAGLIRTSEGILFPDGTVQASCALPVAIASTICRMIWR